MKPILRFMRFAFLAQEAPPSTVPQSVLCSLTLSCNHFKSATDGSAVTAIGIVNTFPCCPFAFPVCFVVTSVAQIYGVLKQFYVSRAAVINQALNIHDYFRRRSFQAPMFVSLAFVDGFSKYFQTSKYACYFYYSSGM